MKHPQTALKPSFFLTLALCTLGLLFAAQEAAAGGFWLPGRGVGPMGRGGAVVATPGDPNALWYNPGGLGKMKGHELLFDASLSMFHVDFQRSPQAQRNGDVTTFSNVSNESPPLPIPQLIFASELFEGSPIKLAIGVYAPYAAPYKFPEDGPQRYVQIDNTQSLLLYQHIAIAWEVHERFSIGAGLQNLSAVIDSNVMGSTFVGVWGAPEDHDLDVLFNIRLSDLFTLTGNIGMWAEPIDGLQVGLSAQLPAKIEDKEAKLKMRLPSHYAFDNASVEGDTLAMSIDLPWIFRGGIRYVVEGVFDVEINVHYEGWSVIKEIATKPDNIRIVGAPIVDVINIEALNVERNYRDIFGVALGGSWEAVPQFLSLSAGFLFEQGAIPDEYFSLFQVDSDKYAPSIGATLQFGKSWEIEAAYTHIFQVDREIKSSRVKQTNSAFEEGATIVANGSYQVSHDLLGLGARLKF